MTSKHTAGSGRRKAIHPKVHIRPLGGVPTLFINGRPTPALAYMTFDMRAEYVEDFARAGVEVFQFSTTSDYDYYRFSADAWIAPGKFDYAQFDERMDLILRSGAGGEETGAGKSFRGRGPFRGREGKVWILPRIYLCSPPWWDKQHPDQLMAGKDGVYNPEPDFGWLPASVSEKSLAPRKMTVPSFSSQEWLRDTAHALQRFLRHAEKRYGRHTIGYHICSGGSQEWYYWGAFENTFPDYSRPQQEAFARWLEARGAQGSERPIPSVNDRLAAEFGLFRDPADPKAARVIEYLRFHTEALYAALSRYCAATRQVIGPDKIIGTFYAYFVDLQRNPTCWHNSGQLGFQLLAKDPNINFVSSPTAYKDRSVGRGFSIFNSLTHSLARHGKLWWNENDIHTHLTAPTKDKLFLHPTDPLETQHLQRREFANALCHGCGSWWFDMWSGWYDDPALMADVKKMMEISRRALSFNRAPAAEIAVVLDDASIYYTQCSNELTVPLISDQLMALGHLGAPFTMVHVDDLSRAGRYKLYLFLDQFYVTPERLRRIRKLIRAPGRTSCFVYAPGLAGSDGLSVGRMEVLTGITLAADHVERPWKVTVTARGWPTAEYGADTALSPLVHATDRRAEVLGTIADIPGAGAVGSGADRAGLVRKKVGGGTVVFSAAPSLPVDLLRRLATDAGVHRYADQGENVYASKSFLGVCAAPGKSVRLALPRAGKLYDLFADREVAMPEGGAELPASGDGTWVFFRGSKRRWQSR